MEPNNQNETIEAADLNALTYILAHQEQQQRASLAAEGAVEVFKAHISAKYKLKPGDGLDVATGTITRSV